jgi:hypothetical protein
MLRFFNKNRKDDRKHERLGCAAHVRIRLETGLVVSGDLLDISRGGFKVRIHAQVMFLGTPHLTIAIRDRQLSGRLIRRAKGSWSGCFDSLLSDNELKHLSRGRIRASHGWGSYFGWVIARG